MAVVRDTQWLEIGEDDNTVATGAAASRSRQEMSRLSFLATRTMPTWSFVLVGVLWVATVVWIGFASKPIVYRFATGALPPPVYTGVAEPAVIHFVHFNDVYMLQPQNGRGGMALAAGLVEAVREFDPDAMVTLAGDVISPSAESTIFKGAQMIDGLNAMNLTVSCLGNHEFDFPLPILEQRLAQSNFPWVNTNVFLNGEILPGTVPTYKVTIERANAVVCFVGLLYDIAASGYFVSAEIKNQYEAVSNITTKWRETGECTIIAAITHQSKTEDCALAGQFDDFDVILGGHEHDVMDDAVCGRAPYIKSTSDFNNVWVIEMRVNETGHALSIRRKNFPMAVGMKESPKLANLAAKWYSELNETMMTKLGHNSVSLDYRTSIVRTQESNLGDYITDAIRAAVKSDIAVMNGGGIRGNSVKPPGDILRQDVINWHPFNEDIMLLYINGSDLRAFMTWGIQLVDMLDGRFPQISGFNITFANIPGQSNPLLKLQWPTGEDIQDSERILLATLPFLHSSAPAIANIPEAPFPRGNVLAAIEHMLVTGDSHDISTQVCGRIQIVSGSQLIPASRKRRYLME